MPTPPSQASSLVRIPSTDEEDLRRSHRERSRLDRERTAHIKRIKGLLFARPNTIAAGFGARFQKT
jgi:transposase